MALSAARPLRASCPPRPVRRARALRRFFAGAIGAVWAAGAALAPSTASAEVGAYLLFDMADGAVIAQHKAGDAWYPASLTKLMTAYVTFQAVERGELAMTSPVVISPQARQQPPSRMGFALGTRLTVETALRIILTKSANDVSVALAEAVGGTQAGFMGRMNDAADALGMTQTFYDNPHGLPNRKQITSARDTALLMMALDKQFPERADFFTMAGITLNGKRYVNYNALIRKFPGADGMKTGFICASGFNLAASATRDGLRLGAVVLGGLTSRERDERTAELLEKGFEAARGGGNVALDGFGDPNGHLVLARVQGERPDLGTVGAIEESAKAVANRRSEVCGARKPTTRYDNGVVNEADAVIAQKSALVAYTGRLTLREARIAEVLAEPLVRPAAAEGDGAIEPVADDAGTPVTASVADRTLADPSLRPGDWDAATPGTPVRHPDRPAAPQLPQLAPSNFVRSPSRPVANPLEAEGLRAPLEAPPPPKPLTYLKPARSIPYVALFLGRTDAARPKPLSGAVVGGGPAPTPRAKPEQRADSSDNA